jgi:hypothetical protein
MCSSDVYPLGGGAVGRHPARSSMRRDDAPLFLGENALRSADFARFRRRRGGNAIWLADHFHGLAFIQITADGAIGQISLGRA